LPSPPPVQVRGFGNEARSVTASFGVAMPTGVTETERDVIVAADHARYAAKNSGRNGVVFDSRHLAMST
jgi:GGDEF domain-containing protein